MKRQELQQLKNKPLPELSKNLSEYRDRLRQLRFDLAFGKVKNVREIRAIKKMIARVSTLINQNK